MYEVSVECFQTLFMKTNSFHMQRLNYVFNPLLSSNGCRLTGTGMVISDPTHFKTKRNYFIYHLYRTNSFFYRYVLCNFLIHRV